MQRKFRRSAESRLSGGRHWRFGHRRSSHPTTCLRKNRLTLDKEDIEPWGKATKDEVLLYAALSAKWENNDAIDRAVTGAVGSKESLRGYKVEQVVPFNPVDKKTTAAFTGPDGHRLLACKGAPQIVAAMLCDSRAKTAVDAYMAARAARGLRALGVAKSGDEGATWQLVGLISLLDPPREDTKRTIELAGQLGIEVKMVTGDQRLIAVETCRRLGMGTNIMEGANLMQGDCTDADLATKVTKVDGFAGVYPEHKHRIVAALQSRGCLVGMTGDGVNDAPALKKANVGIAVAGATSAAKGAADIILTEEGLSPIITAIQASRTIFARLQAYLIYRIASSLLILGFFFFAIIILGLEMPTWAIIVINITNDVSVKATSFDKVHSSNMPQTWNMTKCLVVAACTAAVGVAGSVVLLYLSLPSRVNWFAALGTPVDHGLPVAPHSTNGQVVALIFLALMILIQLNIFATRNPGLFWQFTSKTAPRPSSLLVAAVACVLLPATLIAVYWPENIQPDGGRGVLIGAGWAKVGIVWAYAIAVWLIADAAKTGVQALFIRQERVKEDCKVHSRPLPLWVRAVDWPGNAVTSTLDRLAKGTAQAAKPCTSTTTTVKGSRKGPANDSAQELGDVIIDIPQASANSK